MHAVANLPSALLLLPSTVSCWHQHTSTLTYPSKSLAWWTHPSLLQTMNDKRHTVTSSVIVVVVSSSSIAIMFGCTSTWLGRRAASHRLERVKERARTENWYRSKVYSTLTCPSGEFNLILDLHRASLLVRVLVVMAVTVALLRRRRLLLDVASFLFLPFFFLPPFFLKYINIKFFADTLDQVGLLLVLLLHCIVLVSLQAIRFVRPVLSVLITRVYR